MHLDPKDRILPLLWRRKCNGKLYALQQVHDFFGTLMVWLYEDNSNRMLHLPLSTLVKCYKAEPVRSSQQPAKLEAN